MKTNRIWLLGTAIVVIAVLALGYLLGISPKLTELAAGEASLTTVTAQNAQEQAKLLSLQKEFENIDELQDQLDELQAAIPADVSLPDFIRQLNELAATTQVRIDSITTGPPEAYITPGVPGTILDADRNVVPLPAAPASLITVNFSIKVSGPAGSIQNFTEGLQKGKRLFLARGLVINSVIVSATEDAEASTSFDGEIQGLAYVLEVPAAPAS